MFKTHDWIHSAVKKATGVLTGLSIIAALSACSSFTAVSKDVDKSISAHRTAYKTALQKEQARFAKDGFVVNAPLLAGERIEIKRDNLPPVFSQRVAYRANGESYASIIKNVLSAFKLDASFTQALISDSAVETASKSASADNDDMPTLPGYLAQAISKKRDFAFRGSLKQFLNHVADTLDLNWKFQKDINKVVFYKFESRSFAVSLPRSIKKVTASISLSESSTGGGSVSVNSDAKVDTWSALLGGVRVLLGGESGGSDTSGDSGSSSGPASGSSPSSGTVTIKGLYGTATAYPDLGYLTVMARPFVMDKIAKHIESINKQFSRNILIDMKVLNLSVNRNANAGFSFDMVRQKLGEYDLALSAGGLITPSSGNSPSSLSITKPNGTDTLTAVIQALSSLGDVSIKTQGQVLAINGQPAPFQQAQEISYVKNVSVQNTPNVGTTQTPETETKVIGFTANFLPVLLKDGRVLLDYQIQNSTLVGFSQFTFGGSTIQLPQVASQSLQNDVVMADGQSLMLFSFEREQNVDNNQHGFSSISYDANQKKDMAIILLTVHVDKTAF